MSITGIPSSENIILHRIARNGDSYRITTNDSATVYTLYKIENNKAIKIAKGSNPLELENKYVK